MNVVMSSMLVICSLSSAALASVDFQPFFWLAERDAIRIVWMTLSEENNDYFVVSRADNLAEPFDSIGYLPGHGTTDTGWLYRYRDSTAVRGVPYYYLISDVDSFSVRTDHAEWTPHDSLRAAEFRGINAFPFCPVGDTVTWRTSWEYGIRFHEVVMLVWIEWFPGFGQWEPFEVIDIPSQGNSDSGWTYGTRFPELFEFDSVSYDAYSVDSLGRLWDTGRLILPEPLDPWVNLSEFAATRSETQVEFTWTTVYELGARCFRLVRIAENGSVTPICQMQCANRWPWSYACVDTNAPGSGDLRYVLSWSNRQNESVALVDTILISLARLQEETPLPQQVTMSASPNPFNPSTKINLSLPATAHTTLTIFDLLGREVRELHNGLLTAGSHTFLFDGASLPTGIYVARAQSGDFVQNRKLLLLK